jgi:hypothetical protein
METRQPALEAEDEEDEACRSHRQAVDAALEQLEYIRWFIEHVGRCPGARLETLYWPDGMTRH